MPYLAPDTIGGGPYLAPDEPAAGGSSVSADFAATFAIAALVSADFTAAYSITNIVGANFQGVFLIEGNIIPDLKPISVAQFRLDFPEFADPVKYTDAQITRQLKAATVLLSELRWDDSWGYGIELRTAHYLTVAARNAVAVAAGGVGGAVSGLLTSKSVDKVSAGYDVGATTYEGAGFWNTTSYGIEFWQLSMMFGAGPLQL